MFANAQLVRFSLEVLSGQGTIGLELLEHVPDLEAVVVLIGGGGLIGGIGCALKESNPKIRVVGVEPEKLPSMLHAREAGAPVTIVSEATIADGIAAQSRWCAAVTSM